MNKRMNLLVAGIVLVSLLTMAFDTVPSITIGGMYSGSTTSSGSFSFSINVIPDTPTVKDLLEQMKDQKPISGFFDGQQAAMQAALPEGTNLEDLALQELCSLEVKNYTAGSAGQLDLSIKFPTQFDPDKPVSFLIGFVENGQVKWQVIPAQVDEDGDLRVILSDELLLKIQAGNAVAAVLS